VQNRLTLRGFLVNDHADVRPRFTADMSAWLAEGTIVWRKTVVDGLENAVTAFRGLLTGGNTGKMLVRLGDSGR
jgi:NADPH-dependent curcumin reductase CurA